MSEVKLRLLSELFYERLVLIVLYRGLTPHAYKFQDESSKRTSSGLDFSKSVIVQNDDEIGDAAHIDSAERKELLKRYKFIVEKFQRYVDDFIAGLKK